MEKVYRCTNCKNDIKKDDLYCSKCGGKVIPNYVGAGFSIEVIGINKAIAIQYVKVEPRNNKK